MLETMFHKGSGGAGVARYSNAVNCLAVSTVAPAIDKLWAMPIYLKAGTLDRIGFEVTTGGGSGNKARIFLFSNKGAGSLLYPDRLLIAGTEEDGTAAAVKETTVSYKVDDGLHWIVYTNGGGTVATVRAVAVGGLPQILGCTSTPTPITAVSKGSVTYSATLSSLFTNGETFPASGSYETAAMPLVWVRYSA